MINEVCTWEVNSDQLKTEIKEWANNLILYLLRIMKNTQVKPRKKKGK